jgi:hypothetical protein
VYQVICIRTNTLILGLHKSAIQRHTKAPQSFSVYGELHGLKQVVALPAIWNGYVCVYTRYVFIHLKNKHHAASSETVGKLSTLHIETENNSRFDFLKIQAHDRLRRPDGT